MSIAEIIKTAAYNVLLPPGEDAEQHGNHGSWRYHRYSCNAILFAFPGKATEETKEAHDWYYYTVLCADRAVFPASALSCLDEPQETRFMLMLFASYLAADEGL